METDELIEIDFTSKMEIKINNTSPVELTGLTLALLNVGHLYEKFIEGESVEEEGVSTELYIKEVRSGSIIVELVSNALPVIPLLWDGGGLTEWVKYAKNTTDWLSGKIKSPQREQTKNELKSWGSVVGPVAKDSGSQMNITVSDNGKVINQFFIDSTQANAIQNGVTRELEKLDEPDTSLHKNKVMYWYQAKFDTDSMTGDRAIIESISKKPVKVMFDNDAIKNSMLKPHDEFDRPWQELAYIVDVRVETVRDVPKIYTVVRYHEDETFDPKL